MSDSTRHLTQGPQALLLQDGLLRLTQVVIGLLQDTVNLRLIGRERDVFAQLPKKLTFAAAEIASVAARSQQNSEDLALAVQGRADQRAKSVCAHACGQANARRAQIRFIHQFSAQTTG